MTAFKKAFTDRGWYTKMMGGGLLAWETSLTVDGIAWEVGVGDEGRAVEKPADFICPVVEIRRPDLDGDSSVWHQWLFQNGRLRVMAAATELWSREDIPEGVRDRAFEAIEILSGEAL